MKTSTSINLLFLLTLLVAFTSCQDEEINVINESDLIEKSDRLKAIYVYLLQPENGTVTYGFSGPLTTGNGSDTVYLYKLPDSSFVNYRTHEYNDQGDVTETNVFDEDNQLIETYIRELSYWPNGQLKTVKNSSSETTYNEKGDMIENKHFNEDGDLQSHTTYVYTYKNGLKVKSVMENKNFPETENISGLIVENPQHLNQKYETKYFYNFGKIVKSINYIDGKAVSSNVQSYDKYGYPSESKFYYEGEFAGSRKLDYNKNGVLLGDYSYGGDGTLQMEIGFSYNRD